LDEIQKKLSIKIKKLNYRVLDVLAWRILIIFRRRILGVLSRRVFSFIRRIFGRQDQRSDRLLHSRLSENYTIIFWISL